ncbi:MAG: protein kinase [Planctomycetes bacterium]|nr:protein kinase [Planctomycetota bacterium]
MAASDEELPELPDDIAAVLFDRLHRAGPGGAAIDDLCALHPEYEAALRAHAAHCAELPADVRIEPTPKPTQPRLEPGAAIGPYQLREQLGRGGMGVVWRAHDPRLGRDVALKLMAGEFANQPSAARRFLREARAVAGLEHPGIVRILEVGEVEGAPFLAMELVPGSTLDSALRRMRREQERTGAMPPTSKVAILGREIAAALHHAHERGVVHRDIKPQNIIVRPDGKPVLLDFGLAQLADEARITRAGDFVGTVQYASPEQVSPAALAVDHRTDVYSLGVTLFELLTLTLPFTGTNTQQLVRRITAASPPSARARNPAVPRDLDAIIARALAKEPQQRYRNAGELADDLDRFVRGSTVAARPVKAWTRAWRWSRLHPAPTAAVTLGTLLAMAIGLVVMQTQIHAATNRRHAETAFFNARELLRGGRFEQFVTQLEEARRGGYGDETALRLLEFDAWRARGEFDRAATILASCPPRSGDPAQTAKLLLDRGDFLADRLRDPGAGLDLVREALASGGLSAAEEAYARCLVADNLVQARAGLDTALLLDPGYRAARVMAIWLAIGSGEIERGRLAFEQLRTDLPGDINLPVLHRLLSLLGAEPQTQYVPPTAVLAASPAWQAAETLFDALPAALEFGREMTRRLSDVERPGEFAVSIEYLQRLFDLNNASAGFGELLQGRGATMPDFRAQGLAIHPLIVAAWRPFLTAGAAQMLAVAHGADRTELAAVLQRSAEHIDDGFFHFLLARLHGLENLSAARAAMQRAIERPSLLPIRRHALLVQFVIDSNVAVGRVQGLDTSAIAADLTSNVEAMLRYPDLTETEFDLAFTAPYIARAWPLADRAADEWRRRCKRSTMAIKAQADLAQRLCETSEDDREADMQIHRARRLCDEALAIEADCEWAGRLARALDSALARHNAAKQPK